MPELPEVACFRKRFELNALDRKIARARVNDPRIVRGVPPEELEKGLAGGAFTSTRQHGKYLFAKIEKSAAKLKKQAGPKGAYGMDKGAAVKWLVMHFGMTGFLETFDPAGDEPAYTRLAIRFETGPSLAYVNARMLGWIGLAGDPDTIIQGKKLGPPALDNDLDLDAFRDRFSRVAGAIKPALMNQQIIAGIGNIYSDEILLQSCVHPGTRVRDLGGEKLKTIFEKTAEVLRTAVDRDADFERFPAGYLLRDRRKGASCPVCGTKLQTAGFSGRTAYFCPQCQQKH